MQKQIYYLGKISVIIVWCALFASAGAASQDLQNEFNQEEETNDPVNKGLFPADFWTSREVKVSWAVLCVQHWEECQAGWDILQIDETPFLNNLWAV